MEGFSDLLWLLIMFLVITRGLGAARKGKEPPQPNPSPDLPERSPRTTETAVHRADRPAGRELSQAQPSSGQRARAGRRLDPLAEYRRRLVDAAREWEVEQRRRAGLPIEEPPPTPLARREATMDRSRETSRPRAHPPARPRSREERFDVRKDPRRAERELPRRRRASPEARDVTPDRVVEQAATGEETPAPRETYLRPRRPERSVLPSPAESREAPAPTAGTATGLGSAHEPLARLDRFQPLKRAVVLAEILGLPKGVADDPFSRRGHR